MSLIAPLLEIVGKILEPITELIKKLVEGPLSGLSPILDGLSKLLSGALGTALEFVMTKVEVVTTVFSDLLDFISNVFAGDWKGAWDSIVKTFGDIFGGIVEIVKFPLNKIIELINSAIDGFNKIQIPDWVPAVGGKGLNIPKIPKLAEGGIIDKSGIAMVGEAGPELLSLPRGASVTPLSEGIDYDKLLGVFVAALREVAPELATNVRIEGNRDALVDIMIQENNKSINSTGRALFA